MTHILSTFIFQMDKEDKHEHAKFLLYQIQQELCLYQECKNCVIQCDDGSFLTSSTVIFSMSSTLSRFCTNNSEDHVLVVPDLQLGELLLFMKYVFSNKVKEMFSSEDISVIDKVCSLLSIDQWKKPNIQEILANNDHQNVLQPLENTFPSLIDSSNEKSGENFKESRMLKRIQKQDKLKSSPKCPFCDESTEFILLRKHIKQKHPEQEFTCLECHHQLVNKSEFLDHIQIHDKSQYYLVCDRCQYVCYTQYQLQSHRKTHNIKKFKSINCEHCPRIFQVQEKYNRHVEQHKSGQFDSTFNCGKCGKTFKKETDLKRHLKTHDSSKSYACNVCGDKFVDSTRLKQHKWIHENVKRFVCNVDGCKERFRQKSNLNNHQASFHPNSMMNSKLKCSFCSKQFAYEYKLKQHEKWHSMDKSERIKEDDPCSNNENI